MLVGAYVPVMASEEVLEIHVATTGSAAGAGTAADPVDSLESARALVKSKKTADPNTPINVIFHGGEYRFSKTVNFDQNDSGSAGAPITYMAAEGEKVTFTGAERIDASKFKPVEDEAVLCRLPKEARGKVMVLDLAEQGFESLGKIPDTTSMYYTASMLEPTELYLDNKQQTMARWPNGKEGYACFESVTEAGGTVDGNPNTAHQTEGGTFVVAEDRIERWTNAADAYIVGFLGYDWSYDRTKVGKIDAENKSITLAMGTSYKLRDEGSRRWAIINLLEELDMPGEWYIDHSKGLLYYYPEAMTEDSVLELTTLADNMICLDGTDYIEFRGICFSKLRGSAFWTRTTNTIENLKIDNCIFENIGRYGIWHSPETCAEFMRGNSQETQYRTAGLENAEIVNNTFRNIGVSAMFVHCGDRQTNVASGCKINNNYFSYIGEANRKGVAAEINGVGIEIKNNTVHEAGYGIIFVGSKIEVANNEIYNVMKHVNDGSAIYTGRNFVNRGNKVHDNYIHDVVSKDSLIRSNNAHGIYLDDMDSGTEVYNNFISGVDNGVLVNCGMSNNVHDNTIVNAGSEAVCVSHFNEGSEASIARINDQAEKALANDSYKEYWEEIKADVDSGLVSHPARNTVCNNVMYKSELKYDEYILENNTVSGNSTVTEEPIPSTAGIGIDASKFSVNPLGDTSFSPIYPQNNRTLSRGGELSFYWQSNDALDKYHIIIARDENFSDIADEQYLYERIYTTDKVSDAGTYYWKVVGENESIAGGRYESEVFSFTVDKCANIGEEDRYVTFDLSASANAIGFAAASVANTANKSWMSTLLDVQKCVQKGRNNYLSMSVANGKDENGSTVYTEKILYVFNKNAFDHFKDSKGIITADNGVPFSISTDEEKNNIVMLSGISSASTKAIISVPKAKYEELYFPNLGTNGEYFNNFKMTAVYSDSSEEIISTDCTTLFGFTSNKNSTYYTTSGTIQKDGKVYSKYVSASGWIDCFAKGYKSSDTLNTAPLYRIESESDKTVSPLNVGYYIPVYSFKTNPEKELVELKLEGADKYTNVSILAMTGKKTAKQTLSEYESKTSLSAAETERAYTLLLNEYAKGTLSPESYPKILAAKAKQGAVSINSVTAKNNTVTIALNAAEAGDGKKYLVMAALYSGGRLVEIKAQEKTIGISKTDITAELNFSNSIGAKTVKCFVWTDLDNMTNAARALVDEGI